ncbi:hypothetical protein P3102_24185 [Amycolatopsis sp. QT-25]|uniref:hypothetical protein n=1 Tax=Amycolatopsis sp. QT-25 TaxID=3034022 RepID=UPI0023EC4037|nr:hypothetical protein [Amycolatopsis sp. QT-25]WET77183.1 hypothetical protein P3102_24185 [Amycolatopsis sp. QT-25]
MKTRSAGRGLTRTGSLTVFTRPSRSNDAVTGDRKVGRGGTFGETRVQEAASSSLTRMDAALAGASCSVQPAGTTGVMVTFTGARS